ncbi:MAG: ATPase domain-containing protein [Ignavibacteriaceae bacterium]
MTKKIQLFPSGIPLVDFAWGGLYRAGTYFLIGPRKSGRTLLALQYALECAQRREVCLFFTTMRPKDLMIHAASIDFDLQHYMNQNLIIVVRVTPPEELLEVGDPDILLTEYIKDIVPVVEQYNPNKIVFDELTPFIGFKDLKFLRDTFLNTIEGIEDAGITSLYLSAEPANPASQAIIDTLIDCSTGIIGLQKKAEVIDKYHSGIMTITPNVGHTEGKFSANYYIEPYKGILVDYIPSEPGRIKPKLFTPADEQKYESFADIKMEDDAITHSNVYSLQDFELIINNQIALYQITGQEFALVSIRLDEYAERKGMLTLNQLKNAIRLSTEKKDKICSIGSKIFVLITRPKDNVVANFVTKIKSNLPNDDPNFFEAISPHISVYAVTVNKDVNNAEGMIAKILKDTAARDEQPRGY